MRHIDEVKQVEASIQRAKACVDLASTLEKLLDNTLFKKVVLEGYFEQEAIRLVHLKADPAMEGAASQASILKQMDAIGSLKQYFVLLTQQGALAIKSIEFDEATRDDLLAEGLNA